jgi:hypothetical protein
VKTGRFSRDAEFRAFVQSLTPEQLSLAGSSPRDAWLMAREEGLATAGETQSSSPKVISLRGVPSIPNPQPPATERINETKRLQAITDRLRDLGLVNPQVFVRDHWPVISTIERQLNEIEEIREALPDELSGVRSIAALFRSNFHEEVKRETVEVWFCPYCSWQRAREPGRLTRRDSIV